MTKTLVAFLILFTSFPMATVALAEERLVIDAGRAPIVLAQNAPGFWNGYHGEQQPRDGFRRGPDGWWYPLAAFAAGSIVGGAVADDDDALPPPPPPPPPAYEPPPRGYRPHAFPPEHYAWCAKRYRSYDASDNSYVPRAGIRAQCLSPYN